MGKENSGVAIVKLKCLDWYPFFELAKTDEPVDGKYVQAVPKLFAEEYIKATKHLEELEVRLHKLAKLGGL